MKRNGSLESKALGLKIDWEVTLTGITAQLGETGQNDKLMAASNITVDGALTIMAEAPSTVSVAAGFINILLTDRKELYYRPREGDFGSRILIKLSNPGPLWDPSDDARQQECFPYSTIPTTIPNDGKSHRLRPFVDSPRFTFSNSYKSQELLWVEGSTVFLICLAIVINHGEEQDFEIPFQYKWLIDWRFRPIAFGINSQGEPMAFEAPKEVTGEIIRSLDPQRTAIAARSISIETTWA
ncbi:MAG TPA: hypothetical protein VIS96_04030 [Terrimicrobiaceae bacterium]